MAANRACLYVFIHDVYRKQIRRVRMVQLSSYVMNDDAWHQWHGYLNHINFSSAFFNCQSHILRNIVERCPLISFQEDPCESIREESFAGNEKRTVPSSGALPTLRSEAVTLFRSALRDSKDNARSWPTDCDFCTRRHCQKGYKAATIAYFPRLPISVCRGRVSSMLYGKRTIHWYDLSSSCSEISMSSVSLSVLDRWNERTDDFLIEFCSIRSILPRDNPEYKEIEKDQSCFSASRPCSDFADAISWLYITPIRTTFEKTLAASTSIAVASPFDIVRNVALSSRDSLFQYLCIRSPSFAGV